MIQGGPMIRLREMGETPEQRLRRLRKQLKLAVERGDDMAAKSYAFAIEREEHQP